MARLTRATQKIFAGSATNNGVFGSLQAGSGQLSNDVETIQSLPAYEQGWNAATISSELLPPLEEFQGLQYANSYQLAYNYQEGIPEWDSGTTYYIGSVVKVITSTGYQLYHSITDNNVGNATSNQSYWMLDFDSATGYALKDLSNSTAITNCITAIPQDIKLELSNGTLTLKAGSKVYVPNGVGVFKEILINSDISLTDATNYNNLFVFYIDGRLERILYTQVFSGTDAPSGTNFLYWYDTKNNLIKRTTDGGSNWTSGNISFPLGLFSTNGTGFSSIDQVFNGFGYIGRTIFSLPGVEGLIPSGRNTDGSLNSIKFTTTSVLTSSRGFSGSLKVYLRENSLVYSSGIYYNELANENQNVGTNIYSNFCEVGTLTTDSTGRVTSFSPKLPVKLADNQEVVHKTGNETIEGEKIFTSNITISNPNGVSIMQCVDPANTNNNAKIQYYVGDNSASFANVQNGSTIGGIRIDNSGYAYSIKPPVATDKSTQIATTQWVRNYGAQLDYSAAITISGTGTKTASVNGVLIGTPIKTNSSESLKITIAGKTFFFAPGNSGEDNNHLSQCYLPVAKGQSYNVVEINGNVQLLLVPYV